MELAVRAMGSLLPKLGELLKEEYGLQKGVKKKVKTLSRELEAAHAVLCKISDIPPDQLSKPVKKWARDVREASYDMEDILDAFLVHIDAPEPATETHMLRLVNKKVSSLFKKSKARRNISSQFNEIYKKLEELAARCDRYITVDSIVPKPVTTIDPRIRSLYKSAKELVGIDGPKQELIDMLSLGDYGGGVPDNKKIKVVSVVGFGGLGKTTLAKAVYDQLKLHFECLAFVPVGRNPDIKKVFRHILIDLDKNTYTLDKLKGLDENQLMGKLNEFVKEKRCFIVIDDIWDMDSWDLIRCALQESNNASRLIITTRISKVAAQADQVYKIKPLSHDNSEKLLFARISDSEGKYLGSPSIEGCEIFLRKCSGVPLAIITIASLLDNRPRKNWSELYNSIGFGHEDNDVVFITRRILSFSYYDLPSHLRSCLLYLSVFPKDAMIERNSLIWKWIAEDFITEEQAAAAGVGLFELGERYFNELINRNMIQSQDRIYGYIWRCSVDNTVLDLMHQLSSEENFVTVLNNGDKAQKLRGCIPRRLTLQCAKEHNAGQLASVRVENVRSIYASECDFYALCSRLPFLRVVEMVECDVYEDCNRDCLDHLWSLRHLRYLRLTSISQLPREVGYLRFLQTLDVWNNNIAELPKEVGLLTQLVCLRVGDGATSVPTGLIGKLTSLQELWIYCEGEDARMRFVKELGLLRELRVLWTKIPRASESLQRCLLESLENLHNIKEIQIEGSSLNKDDAAGLISCRHLQFLSLESFVFARLPAWINSSLAPNLSYLNVNVVVVKDQDMEALAKLPELSCLILQLKCNTNKSVVSIKTRTDDGYFRKLRFLTINGASIWFDLRGSECNSSMAASTNTIMPCLESLEFDVHVRSLKDHNLQLGFDMMISFQNLGTSSLQRVTAYVYCRGAAPREVVEAEAVLKHVAAVHPKHPTLQCIRTEERYMITRYQEGEMSSTSNPHRAAGLVNNHFEYEIGSWLPPQAMPLELMRQITNNFSERLGRGTYGTVYKGVLNNGKEVAVKLLHSMAQRFEIEEKEFWKELENLRRLNHPNIVQLLGYCYGIEPECIEHEGRFVVADKITRALCLEYMHNTSLQGYLDDESVDWQTRYKIILGTCEGLQYLHKGLENPMLHLDLKPGNILLDQNMEPKLADFGLSKLIYDSKTQIASKLVGTRRYCPPEHFRGLQVSSKFDIFSLGVVMIEIIAGSKGYDKTVDEMPSHEFLDHVQENWIKRIHQATTDCASPKCGCSQVKTCIKIALECVHPERMQRPNIEDILSRLNETENNTEKSATTTSSQNEK